jgi:hypothetical protein
MNVKVFDNKKLESYDGSKSCNFGRFNRYFGNMYDLQENNYVKC